MTASPEYSLPDILRESPVRVVFGPGTIDRLGAIVQEIGAKRVLLVTDPGIVAAGHVETAAASLRKSGMDVMVFDGARENPTTEHVAAGLVAAKKSPVDLIIGLGGGSAMDCAKGVNILLAHGGEIRDYWGVNKTTKPMLPFIAVPTTAGTGSEAQSFALITDPKTHQKMACGDRRAPDEGGLRPRVAILDPDLTRTAPPAVTAAAGIDAVAHAVETAGTTVRNPVSRMLSREAWKRLEPAFVRVLKSQDDAAARAEMMLGAHFAGAAIEHSMLGAAHACANPLTARCGVIHGVAVGVMLPHVVRFNSAAGDSPYADLDDNAERLAERLTGLLTAADLPKRLGDLGVTESLLNDLAVMAAEQWTAGFNPRAVGSEELSELYRAAL